MNSELKKKETRQSRVLNKHFYETIVVVGAAKRASADCLKAIKNFSCLFCKREREQERANFELFEKDLRAQTEASAACEKLFLV